MSKKSGVPKKKIIFVSAGVITTILVIVFVLTLRSDLNVGIQGTWILDHEIDSHGNEMTTGMLRAVGIVEECYVIKGTDVQYSCILSSVDEPETIDLVLEDLGDDMYNFNYPSGETFVTVTVYGKVMTYTLASGESYVKMVFLKK